MSYANVLRGLTAGEEANVNRKIRNDNILISNQRERNREKLQAISVFSKSLDGFVKNRVEKTKKEDIERGKIQAIEEDLESREGIGITQIPPEEEQQYYVDKESVITNKKQLNETANTVIEDGGSFQDGKDISNLSGWALYSYVQQKSKIAADGYEGWLAGEMKNNEDLQLEYKGTTFTPSTAETLSQKAIALKALRRRYLVEQGLLDVNRALLNDKDVGFYDKVLAAHTKLTTQYERAQDIDDGIRIRENAFQEFIINKDFALLLGEVKRTSKTNGSSYNRKEALDETFEIIKNSVLNGDITLEELAEIKNQEIVVNGETTTAGKWVNRWRDLETELAEESKKIAKTRLDQFDAAKKNIEADWKELEVSSEEAISDEDKAKFIDRWTSETGEENPPSWMSDYLTAEDNDDTSTLDFHLDTVAGGRGYLIEADLYGMSKSVKKKYKSFVKSDQDILTENAFKSKADRAIKAQLKTITGLAAEDSDAEYENALTNAEADYENEYLAALSYTDPANAHKIALDTVKENFAGKDGKLTQQDASGIYFKKSKIDKASINQQAKETREVWKTLEKASVFFEDTEDMMDYLKNNKLPHVDEHLELARNYKKLGKKIVPDYFKRIARKYPDIQGWDIMDAQLKLDQRLKGEKEEGAGEQLLEVEIFKDETLEGVNTKVNYKPNQFSRAQAGLDVLDIKTWLDSTDDITVFKSVYNTDASTMMPGIKLEGF